MRIFSVEWGGRMVTYNREKDQKQNGCSIFQGIMPDLLGVTEKNFSQENCIYCVCVCVPKVF
jgi:hypothetical protein